MTDRGPAYIIGLKVAQRVGGPVMRVIGFDTMLSLLQCEWTGKDGETCQRHFHRAHLTVWRKGQKNLNTPAK
ncbi:MAG: hypothetical protein DI604_25060 [Delftia acidovorans]|nr:MAG: hypothetical protein DI604_25060 [Delftia acidovorans]